MFPATRGTLLESEWRRAVADQVAVEFENYYVPRDSWFHVKAYPVEGRGALRVLPRHHAAQAVGGGAPKGP